MLQQNQHLSKDLRGAMILGQIISIDDWVPERPPKNTSLRIPSPDLPPPPNVENVPPLNQDDPLPPPPPELLKPEPELKVNMASRRNSFAGQSTNVKVKTNKLPLSPPAIPMRPKIVPTPIMTVNSVKNLCQMPQEQTVHAQRVIVPKSGDDQNQLTQQTSTPRTPSSRVSDSRVSVRKRAHNSKDCIGYIPVQQQTTPPPLKPRMRNQIESPSNNGHTPAQNVYTPIVNKVR
jgi:protein Shroom